MLREIQGIRQLREEVIRRWFTDSCFDLFIWQDNLFRLIGFQLSYDKQSCEQVIEWKKTTGFKHYQVDSGELSTDKFKLSPLLIENNNLPAEKVAHEFLINSKEISQRIVSFIESKLNMLLLIKNTSN